MSKLTIRDFQPGDLETYLDMSREFYSSSAVDHGVPEEYFRRSFEQCLAKSPYIRGMLIYRDGELAGYMLLSLTWSNEVGGLAVLLEELYLSPAHRGGGIGSETIALIEEQYPEARRFRLEVSPANEAAARLYTRLGYSPLNYNQMAKDL